MRRIRLGQGDIAVIVLVAVALLAAGGAALGFFRSGGALTARVVVDGAVVDTIPLEGAAAGDRIYETPYGSVTVRVEDGRICVIRSDCPDQVCVRTGWLTRAGQSAVCVPNRVAITVTGSGREVDAVVG